MAARLRDVDESAVREILKLTERPEILSLAGGLPAAEQFDVQGLTRAFDAVLRGPSARGALQYSVTEGDETLREQLALLSRERRVGADVGRTLVTTGSQQALDLAATAILDPGDVVVVERPCYLAALQLFRLAGARIVAAATDEDGLDPDAVEAAIRDHGAKAVYTVANFQNPTGATLAAERRRRLAEIATRTGVWIIEDDPYGELRYRGTALPPLATLAPEHVIYVSSLSKVVAPGLRIGWVVVPPALRRAFVMTKQARDLHTSTLDQRAVAAYLASGALPDHLNRLREAYSARLDTLLEGLGAAVPDGSRWSRPKGGMFVWLMLPEGTDAAAVLEAAVRQGVAFVPGAPFYASEPVVRAARLSFVTLDPPHIREALARLRRAFDPDALTAAPRTASTRPGSP